MSVLEMILTGGTVLVAIYSFISILFLTTAILNRRDRLYKTKYQDYLRQKNRVLRKFQERDLNDQQ